MQETFTMLQMSATKGFGDRLAQERREKAARDRRDISQKDVAIRVGSSEPSVSRWESGLGVPHDPTLQRLADYFGVTLGWLRYGQEPRKAPVSPEPPVATTEANEVASTEPGFSRPARQAAARRPGKAGHG